MAELIGSATSLFTGVDKQIPVANGVTVTSGDFVALASGRATNASIASAVSLHGIVLGGNVDPSDHSDTQTTTGNTAGTLRGTVLVANEPNAKYLIPYVGTPTAAMRGQYFTLSGGTGAQTVTISSASTTGQVELVDFYNGDVTKPIFIISRHAYKQSA